MNEKWNITGSGSECDRCRKAIEVNEPFYSALVWAPGEDGEPAPAREDYCEACWPELREGPGPREGEREGGNEGSSPEGEAREENRTRVIAFWRTIRVPREEPKRAYAKLDIDLVWEIFRTMDGDSGTGFDAELRYVLALMLLRRRRLELKRSGGGRLEFKERKGGRVFRLADPVLSEERIAALTERLGELLWEREFAALESE